MLYMYCNQWHRILYKRKYVGYVNLIKTEYNVNFSYYHMHILHAQFQSDIVFILSTWEQSGHRVRKSLCHIRSFISSSLLCSSSTKPLTDYSYTRRPGSRGAVLSAPPAQTIQCISALTATGLLIQGEGCP